MMYPREVSNRFCQTVCVCVFTGKRKKDRNLRNPGGLPGKGLKKLLVQVQTND